jgi:hypothetical protein
LKRTGGAAAFVSERAYFASPYARIPAEEPRTFEMIITKIALKLEAF